MRHLIPAMLTAACLAALSSTANAQYTVCAFGQLGAAVTTHNFQSMRLPSGREMREGVSATSAQPTRARAYAPFSANESLEISFCGPWLDITSSADVSGAGIRVDRIVEKGVRDRGVVVRPSARGGRPESPYVTVRFIVQAGAEPGIRSVRLRRPSLTGGDTTTYQVDLQRNIRIHEPQLRPLSLDLVNNSRDHQFSFSGQGVNTWIRGVNAQLPATGMFERLTITSRRGDAISFSARVREGGGQVTHGQFFNDYLELTSGTVLVHTVRDARHTSNLIVARDSSVVRAPQPVQPNRPITTEGVGVEASSPDGGMRLPGRVGSSQSGAQTGSGGSARTPRPDLAVRFNNTFTSTGPEFRNNDINSYNLCPPRQRARQNSAVFREIPSLRIIVTNLGGDPSPSTTVRFDTGSNDNFTGNRSFNVRALQPGESQNFDIARRESVVAAIRTNDLNQCQRCADGSQCMAYPVRNLIDVQQNPPDEEGRPQPDTVTVTPVRPPDSQPRYFWWSDIGVSATLTAVSGDNNTSNDTMTLR